MSDIGSGSTQAPAGGLQLVLPGRRCSAGAGLGWISGGWRIFVKAPVMWIITLIVLFVIAIIAGFIPIIGSLAFQAVTPVFSAGFVVACRSLEQGGPFELEHLFAGFKTRFKELVIVGLLYMLGGIVILLVMAGFVGFSILTAFLTGDPNAVLTALAASALTLALGTLIALALGLLLVAAVWFAPALVMMNNLAPLEAMKASFFACFRNFIPFLLYAIVMLILAIIAAIPIGLGMLVWVPLLIASAYTAYREIFTQ